MPALRRASLLLAAVVSVIPMTDMPASSAGELETTTAFVREWSVDLPSDYDGVLSHPTGEISAGSCWEHARGVSPLTQYTADGDVLGQVPPSDRGHRFACGPRADVATQASVDGWWYVADYDHDRPVIRTYDGATLVATAKFWHKSQYFEWLDLTMGPGDMLYGILWDGRIWGREGQRIVGMNGRTGEVLFEHSVDCCSGYAPRIEATASGFVVHYPEHELFTYYDSAGNETGLKHRYGSRASVYAWAVDPSGAIWYAPLELSSARHCDRDHMKGLTRYSAGALTKWKMPAKNCVLPDQVRLTPDGAGIVWNGDSSRSAVYRTSSDGGFAQITPTIPTSNDCSYYTCVSDVQTDVYGNAVIAMNLDRVRKPYGDDALVAVVSPTGDVLGQWVGRPAGSESGSILQMALAYGAVSLLLEYDGETQLMHLPFGDVGFDYPRGNLLGTPPQPPASRSYVALGDSFSSGQGVKPYWAGTVWNPDECNRSQSAYSQVLDRISTLAVRGFFACTGAVGDNVWQEPQHPDFPYQLRGLEDLQDADGPVDIITITIGGNDADFESFARACVVEECSVFAQLDILERIDEVVPGEVHEALAAVESRLGEAGHLYVLGYPYMTPDPSSGAEGVDCSYLGPDEMRAARNVVAALNDAIEFEALALKDARVEFIDPTEEGSPFLGHELCSPGEYFFGVSRDQASSFHPNEAGHNAYAELIASHLGG